MWRIDASSNPIVPSSPSTFSHVLIAYAMTCDIMISSLMEYIAFYVNSLIQRYTEIHSVAYVRKWLYKLSVMIYYSCMLMTLTWYSIQFRIHSLTRPTCLQSKFTLIGPCIYRCRMVISWWQASCGRSHHGLYVLNALRLRQNHSHVEDILAKLKPLNGNSNILTHIAMPYVYMGPTELQLKSVVVLITAWCGITTNLLPEWKLVWLTRCHSASML